MIQITSAIIFTVLTAIVVLFQLGLVIGMPCYSASRGAKFPAKDPEYNAENERKYLQKVINENLPKLEKQRLDFLSKDFDPGNNWWGSLQLLQENKYVSPFQSANRLNLYFAR